MAREPLNLRRDRARRRFRFWQTALGRFIFRRMWRRSIANIEARGDEIVDVWAWDECTVRTRAGNFMRCFLHGPLELFR